MKHLRLFPFLLLIICVFSDCRYAKPFLAWKVSDDTAFDTKTGLKQVTAKYKFICMRKGITIASYGTVYNYKNDSCISSTFCQQIKRGFFGLERHYEKTKYFSNCDTLIKIKKERHPVRNGPVGSWHIYKKTITVNKNGRRTREGGRHLRMGL